jgi:hypothetical protein
MNAYNCLSCSDLEGEVYSVGVTQTAFIVTYTVIADMIATVAFLAIYVIRPDTLFTELFTGLMVL